MTICRLYTGFLEGTEFAKKEYMAEKLKSTLQKHGIGGQLAFTSLESETECYASQLVYIVKNSK